MACSPRKDGYLNRKYQKFHHFLQCFVQWKEALNAELKQRDKSYRDNFHAPYIKLLTYEEQISSAQMENLGVSDNENGLPFGGSDLKMTNRSLKSYQIKYFRNRRIEGSKSD